MTTSLLTLYDWLTHSLTVSTFNSQFSTNSSLLLLLPLFTCNINFYFLSYIIVVVFYGLSAALDLMEAWPDTPIIVEMDSRSIVNAVKKKNFPRCYWGRIARRCSHLIEHNPRFNIEWVRRTGNTAAHTLANWAKFEPNKSWTDSFPLCISDVLQKDISNCNFSWLIISSGFQKKIKNNNNKKQNENNKLEGSGLEMKTTNSAQLENNEPEMKIAKSAQREK
jgi:hypothetical protein